jgi:two-component system response regulator RegX3
VAQAMQFEPTNQEPLSRGDIVLDRAARLVRVRGRSLQIATQEFRLLELFMTHADHVLPNTFILNSLWGPEFHGDPSTVPVHVLRLRKKLEADPNAKRHLRTVRGIGYVFDTEPVDPLVT